MIEISILKSCPDSLPCLLQVAHCSKDIEPWETPCGSLNEKRPIAQVFEYLETVAGTVWTDHGTFRR